MEGTEEMAACLAGVGKLTTKAQKANKDGVCYGAYWSTLKAILKVGKQTDWRQYARLSVETFCALFAFVVSLIGCVNGSRYQ
ncbi:MAG: hypothetical protein LBF83_08685 [Spirochaetaceae bacterium]|jgi:hypothetical protein|nr:hypothetical protein [Spirochaetaceae bacterium]